MKKKLSIVLIFLLSYNLSFAASEAQKIKDETDYWLYKNRVESICSKYKENKLVVNVEEYKSVLENEVKQNINDSYILDYWISKYKDDMNNIYNCWITLTQINSIDLILKKIWTNNEIKKVVGEKLQAQKSKLQILYKNNKCINTDNNTLNYRLNILKQTTYETCRYNFYMEYLKSYYDSIDLVDLNYDKNKSKWISAEWYNTFVNQYKTKINYEVSRAYYLFPLSYHAYTEYENYYPIHILLLLIKEDFISFREKFHKVISPINQVWYKIINAMSK